MEGFDFHSLARKDLQALCKLNKIPANSTNVAMADSLQALPQVEGLDELLQTLSSDQQTVPGTPAVPQSARRSAIRRNPTAVKEPETLTRTRRTVKKAAAPEAGGCPPQTPATAVSRRKVSSGTETSKFDLEAGEEVASVQKAYSTRRSVRLLGKSMGKMSLKETDVQPFEVAAGADSSIGLDETSEETNNSCRNLASSMENESHIKDANDGSNRSIKEITDETNVSCKNLDSLMKNETDHANDEVPSLDVEDKENSGDLDLQKADYAENAAADLTHVTDESESVVESSNPDASMVYNSMDTKTEMSHELDAKNIDSNAEIETGKSSDDERLTMEQQEAIVESFTSARQSVNSSEIDSLAEPDVLTPPIRPTLRSIIVMGSNSHQLHTPAPQSVKDSSAVVDTDPESVEKTSEGDVEDDNMEEVSSSAANQPPTPAPQVVEDISADAEPETVQRASEGNVEFANMEEVSSSAAVNQLQTLAPQVIEDSSVADADAKPESDGKASEGDVQVDNMEEVSSFSAANQIVIKEEELDEMPLEMFINKENVNKKKKEFVDMSLTQLSKMLKEKLKLKADEKTEKRQALAENINNGS